MMSLDIDTEKKTAPMPLQIKRPTRKSAEIGVIKSLDDGTEKKQFPCLRK